MQQFEHKVRDLLGIHARPATAISKIAEKFDSDIKVTVGKSIVDLKDFNAFVKTQIGHKDTVDVVIEGEDEAIAAAALKAAFEQYL